MNFIDVKGINSWSSAVQTSCPWHIVQMFLIVTELYFYRSWNNPHCAVITISVMSGALIPTLVCLMSSFVCVVRRPSVVHRSRLSWSVVSYTITATTWTYSVSFIEQVCPTVRPCLCDTDRGREKGQLLGLRIKEPLYCAAYTLLPHSRSPNVLLGIFKGANLPLHPSPKMKP